MISFITPLNTLKDKISMDGSCGIDEAVLKRAEAAECPVLVILADVPSFGYRPRDIRNGLSMPPKFQET